ncbi:cation-transporting P-type ATPase [Lentzea sp. PSKA42]|uniref:Cation-transporting P-type ATPase n=1 Tax=Lentzea indica TaxID=2604800 RepID=A0ABX1FXY6_9PSEU|nr:cation-transporting P-type ATPase [Lentzea indica]NKE63537.1 cation-transporting P-type ATPase [Lentzea indica]
MITAPGQALIQAPWHVAATDVASGLNVDPSHGLTPAEATARLAAAGPNRLVEAPPRQWWRTLVAQVASPLNLVLVVAAVLAGVVERSVKEALIIGLVLLFNGIVGFVQERRADRAMLAALRGMLSPTAKVRRAGKILEVPAAELVPGDVVLVEAGDRVPADGRVLSQVTLESDESGLTGESLPVAKSATPVADDVAVSDRTSMLHMTSTVTRGRAELLVTGTGMNTEIGKVAGLLERTETTRTPLQRQLDQLGTHLAYLAGGAVLLVAVLQWFAGGGIGEIITLAVALGVAAIPEGLPAVVTVTLALGMRRMARQRAIVKRLNAVETLGSTTVICTDKTGTLTLNQMTARSLWHAGRHYRVSGDGYGPDGTITAEDGEANDRAAIGELSDLLVPAVLCNDAEIHGTVLVGDPTEGALVAVANKAGIDVAALRASRPRVAEIPFDSTLKYMVTYHRRGDLVDAFVKGSPDVLLGLATHVRLSSGDVPLDQQSRDHLTDEFEKMAERGERVLAIAVGSCSPHVLETGDTPVLPESLMLTGLFGLLDPPRPEAHDAIAECRTAGITVKMITGDHLATATSIARAVGIRDRGLTGRDLDGLDDAAFEQAASDLGVFGRVAPEHKVRIVQALQRRGDTVAMTGDGVNDAPALKGADIGIAMGVTGSDVSKEAAAMILTDDNFATIVRAVGAGRTIYDNIVKFVRFQVTTNVAAILAMIAGSLLFAGAGVLNPLMLLWVNVIADGPPALALGLEPPRRSVMREPPRRRGAHILSSRRLGRIVLSALVMVTGTLAVHRYGLDRDVAVAHTLAFTTFVLFQLFNILNVRDETDSAFGPMLFRNWRLWAAVGTVLGLQICAVHVPVAQSVFSTAALTGGDWLIAAAVASSVLWVEELVKAASRFRSTAGRG